MTDLADAIADLSMVAQDARAVVAALGAEDDPTLRERVDRVLDRVTKIEESIALLMDDDVEDVPLVAKAGEIPNPDAPIVAGLPPQFLKKKKGAKDGEEPDGDEEPGDAKADGPPKGDGDGDEPAKTEQPDPPKPPADGEPPQRTPKGAPGEEGPAEVGPIDNVADLHNAIRGYGDRVDKVASKRFIKQRAKELGAEDDLPDTWE